MASCCGTKYCTEQMWSFLEIVAGPKILGIKVLVSARRNKKNAGHVTWGQIHILRMPQRSSWRCFLNASDGIISPTPITETLANHGHF